MDSQNVDPRRQPLTEYVSEPAPTTPTLNANMEHIRTIATAVSVDTLLECIDELYNRWVRYPYRHCKWLFPVAMRLFNINLLEPRVEKVEVDAREAAFLAEVNQLYQRCTREKAPPAPDAAMDAPLIDPSNPDDEVGTRLTRVLTAINNMADIVRCYMSTMSTVNPQLKFGEANCIKRWRYKIGVEIAGTKDDIAALTATQRVILHCLKAVYERGLKKYQGLLFEEVMVPLEGGEMCHTHAWRQHAEIKPFIYSTLDKNKHFDRWLDSTSSGNVVANVETYLTNCVNDYELPTLVPDRHLFSFRNAVYDAENDRIYTYAPTDGFELVKSRMVASKFFDLDLPLNYTDPTESWNVIPTPYLDSILDHQGLNEGANGQAHHPVANLMGLSVRDWFYVFMGRMIYGINIHDTWQVILFIKGKAGTGKSTLGKVIAALYNDVDVGVMSNNGERQFGLSAFVDKKIYICYEAKTDFALDQGELQSMVSGEPMSIATKFKAAQSVTWSSHGLLMGNELPAWCDNSGSISRRVVLGVFDRFVTRSDPQLYENLMAEMGHIILKINRAYRTTAYEFGRRDIWSVLHPYFRTNQRLVLANTNSLAHFLFHGDVVFHPEVYVHIRDFKMALEAHVANVQKSTKRTFVWNSDFYARAFGLWGLREEEGTHDWLTPVGVKPTFDTFVHGVCLHRNRAFFYDRTGDPLLAPGVAEEPDAGGGGGELNPNGKRVH